MTRRDAKIMPNGRAMATPDDAIDLVLDRMLGEFREMRAQYIAEIRRLQAALEAARRAIHELRVEFSDGTMPLR
jgi:hypothetical protein